MNEVDDHQFNGPLEVHEPFDSSADADIKTSRVKQFDSVNVLIEDLHESLPPIPKKRDDKAMKNGYSVEDLEEAYLLGYEMSQRAESHDERVGPNEFNKRRNADLLKIAGKFAMISEIEHDRIVALKNLMQATAKSSKATVEDTPTNVVSRCLNIERMRATRVLKMLLGRVPTEDEIDEVTGW